MAKWTARMRKWMIDYAYLVTLGAVLTIVAASAMYTRALQKEQEIAAAAAAPAIAATVMPTLSPSPRVTPTLAPLVARAMPAFAAAVWPVTGVVIQPYDEERLVYWEALARYGTHMALDIRGEDGETVRAVAEGEVTHAAYDALWGWRVIITQEDGREAVYAGLEYAAVQEGQHTSRGQEIGILAASVPCEASLGPHLHMELYRDGKAQDPEGMLPER